MIPEISFRKIESGVPNEEAIRIAHDQVKANVTTYRFRDVDTQHIVLYIPSLEVTSYGETFEQAKLMLKNSLDNYFDYLLRKKPSEIKSELKKQGWKPRLYHNKDYSKVSVDTNGSLQDFNVEEGSLETFALVA